MKELAQPGVISDPTNFVEFMTFTLSEDKVKVDEIANAIALYINIEKSIGQKDPNCGMSFTIGFSAKAWPILFPEHPLPSGLRPFKELKDGDRHFPSTNGDIFIMIKSTDRMDLNFQAAKYLKKAFHKIADLVDDIQSFKYLDNRDLIDFVDGTENPKGEDRVDAIITGEANYKGGSYLTVQKYIDHFEKWDKMSDEEQQDVIGRTKMDDIEIADEKKKPYAHNVKSKVTIAGDEKKMLRQNRVFGNALEHGTMFVGFVADPMIIETSLEQMIKKGEDGHYDHLLDHVKAVSGDNYFVPPTAFLEEISA